MAKRKRAGDTNEVALTTSGPAKKTKSSSEPLAVDTAAPLTIQVVTGSYDHILHGLTATITAQGHVEFADTFLFNAHNSAIRCLALSPPSLPEPGKAQKVMLASGSSDERVNIYNLSAHPLSRRGKDALSSVAPRKISENSKNRELGTLLHHTSTITKLSFPTRSKLISSSEDSTIAVTRTRDFSLLSTIKAPIAQPQGRPSGDTAALGGTPSGVNDFAVHPSMKLMISVSKGERSMRLWNLMTAKKAGVLNFSRAMLQQVGEGRHSGEGRKVIWGTTEDGDEFCVGFDRELLVFGMDSTPKCRVMPDLKRKIHECTYVAIDAKSDSSLLVVSTEDGKIVFFSTKSEDLCRSDGLEADKKEGKLPVAKLIGEMGGKENGVSVRIKDFAISRRMDDLIISAGCSDGNVHIFRVGIVELEEARNAKGVRQIGKLLGSYQTHNRITCIEHFLMIPRPDGVEESEDESDGLSSEEDGDEEEEDVDE
ncbi:WD40-repeat-containing domain protein [Xylariaceae sp. FL0016]|nr:WD40-repeat-containing domain protein [Xylariaceae sp. FL0016]